MKLGSNPYALSYRRSVIKKDIAVLSTTVKEAIKRAIETKLVYDPIGFGKPLRYTLKGYRRLRVGDYRIVFRIDEENRTVIIVAIKHRKIVYAS